MLMNTRMFNINAPSNEDPRRVAVSQASTLSSPSLRKVDSLSAFSNSSSFLFSSPDPLISSPDLLTPSHQTSRSPPPTPPPSSTSTSSLLTTLIPLSFALPLASLAFATTSTELSSSLSLAFEPFSSLALSPLALPSLSSLVFDPSSSLVFELDESIELIDRSPCSHLKM
jgi:hypothetical protein